MKKKKTLETNLERTFPMLPQTDANGRYIRYCNYKHHPGVIIPKQRNKCQDCKYLVIFREEDL